MYGKVIDALKQGRLGEKQIMETTNMKQTPVRVILADLTDQGIINDVFEGSKRKYEARYGAPVFDASGFTRLRAHKFDELGKMIQYAETDGCRMKYLTGYLGDSVSGTCQKCDNDLGIRHTVTMAAHWQSKITSFWENNIPVLAVTGRYSNLTNGVAAAYYGNSNVGAAIRKCKYQKGGDFPDFLLKITVKAFNRVLKDGHYDFLVFVPPTESGKLVEEFAGRLSREIKVPLSCRLLKSRDTQPQKVFQPAVLKRSNIKGAFEYADPDELAGKSVLLFDDICDSGATIKEIGRLLTQCGSAKITPLVIAKTVGGDLDND
jgi:ATP-dependent DNA helicase RecQ